MTVLDLLRLGTIKAVANYLRVGWDLVKDIHKSKLICSYRKISLAKVNTLVLTNSVFGKTANI